MKKATKRNVILYAHIQKENAKWIKQQMKQFGYSPKRGKSQFVDEILTTARAHFARETGK